MPSKPDFPCPGCGKMLWSGRSSAAPEKRLCRECRRTPEYVEGMATRRATRKHVTKTCAQCGVEFTASSAKVQSCSLSCAQKRRAQREGKTGLRVCEVCSVQYAPRYHQQRTCSRACGVRLRREVTGTLPVQAREPKPAWAPCMRKCPDCGKDYLPNSAQQRYCPACGTASRSIMRRYYADPAFRDRIMAQTHVRRADKLGLGGVTVTLTYLMERDRGRCGICRKPVRAKRGPMRASLDHVVPLSRGGTHDLANTQLAHYRCNLRKNNRGGGEQLALVG